MANQPINKKVINYYASFYDVSKELNPKQFYEFNHAIFSVMFYERHIDDISFDDKLLSIAWMSIKHSLKASIDGFCSKQNIDYDTTLTKGVSKGVSKTLTNNVKEKDKGKDKEKENKNGNGNIEAFMPNANWNNEGKFVELLFCVNDLYYHDTLDEPIYISFRFDEDGKLTDLQAYNGFNPVYAYDQLKEKFEKEKKDNE